MTLPSGKFADRVELDKFLGKYILDVLDTDGNGIASCTVENPDDYMDIAFLLAHCINYLKEINEKRVKFNAANKD